MARDQAERIRGLCEGVIAREGYELVDVQMVSERGRAILRMFIDSVSDSTSELGVGVDDCARVSRMVGDILEVDEALSDTYTLEVSSPGLFRPLTKPEHFDRVVGERIKVKTFAKHEGRKVFTGILTGLREGMVSVEVDGAVFSVPLDGVSKANLEPLL
jgi:ribosome maturation factor RimP